MYISTIVLFATSAENPIVSDSVGCGCINSATSFTVAPTFIAKATSAINSPALDPTIPLR